MPKPEKNIYYIYGAVTVAVTRWVVFILVFAWAAYMFLDHGKIALWTGVGAIAGAVLGGSWSIWSLKKLNDEVSSDTQSKP